MKASVLVLAAGIAIVELSPVPAFAHPVVLGKPDAKKAKPPAKEPGPTDIDKKVKLSPDGLHFGMTVEELSKFYEGVLDQEFVALYKAVEPGPRMSELDAELADKKQLILRNKLEFGSLPSGLDNTPLGGEYTYNNSESMTQIKLRSGVTRYFFFFGNSLWKVVDVHKLGKKSKLGEDYGTAVEGLTKTFGKTPRDRKADPSMKDRRNDAVDWQDKETIVRVQDHGSSKAAVCYVDRKIEENIDKHRTNKGDGPAALDRDVADVTRADGKPPEDKNKSVSDAYTKKKK